MSTAVVTRKASPPLGGPRPPAGSLRPQAAYAPVAYGALPPGIPQCQGFALALRAHPYRSPKGGRIIPLVRGGLRPPCPALRAANATPPGKPTVSPARHAGRLPLPSLAWQCRGLPWCEGARNPSDRARVLLLESSQGVGSPIAPRPSPAICVSWQAAYLIRQLFGVSIFSSGVPQPSRFCGDSRGRGVPHPSTISS